MSGSCDSGGAGGSVAAFNPVLVVRKKEIISANLSRRMDNTKFAFYFRHLRLNGNFLYDHFTKRETKRAVEELSADHALFAATNSRGQGHVGWQNLQLAVSEAREVYGIRRAIATAEALGAPITALNLLVNAAADPKSNVSLSEANDYALHLFDSTATSASDKLQVLDLWRDLHSMRGNHAEAGRIMEMKGDLLLSMEEPDRRAALNAYKMAIDHSRLSGSADSEAKLLVKANAVINDLLREYPRETDRGAFFQSTHETIVTDKKNILLGMASLELKNGNEERAYDLHNEAIALLRGEKKFHDAAQLCYSIGTAGIGDQHNRDFSKMTPAKLEYLKMARDFDMLNPGSVRTMTTYVNNLLAEYKAYENIKANSLLNMAGVKGASGDFGKPAG